MVGLAAVERRLGGRLHRDPHRKGTPEFLDATLERDSDRDIGSKAGPEALEELDAVQQFAFGATLCCTSSENRGKRPRNQGKSVR